jgi:hypothetical protein
MTWLESMSERVVAAAPPPSSEPTVACAADAALLRPLGDRMVLEFNHAHTVMIEHMFTVAERGGVRGNLDLLKEFATKLPDLRFADFWHGYLRYLCAESMLYRQEQEDAP